MILLASSIPEPLEASPSDFSDFLQSLIFMGVGDVAPNSFVIHFALYAVLGFLAVRALVSGGWVFFRPAALRLCYTAPQLWARVPGRAGAVHPPLEGPGGSCAGVAR